jgi:hypothetical protein
MTTTITTPVNPLTGDLTTIRLKSARSEGGFRDVEGLNVAPGLAITPSLDNNGKTPDRYSLSHVTSGLAASGQRCGVHIQETAQIAIKSGVNWLLDQELVIAAIKKQADLATQLMGGGCRDWCEGDGPKPPSWLIQCKTCDWTYDEFESEGPVATEADARYIADNHECEPWLEIQAPGTDVWRMA